MIRVRGCARGMMPEPSIAPDLWLFGGADAGCSGQPKRLSGRAPPGWPRYHNDEILAAPDFYYGEDYHQQYLAKNPGGYCGLGGTGVSCSVGVQA